MCHTVVCDCLTRATLVAGADPAGVPAHLAPQLHARGGVLPPSTQRPDPGHDCLVCSDVFNVQSGVSVVESHTRWKHFTLCRLPRVLTSQNP